ncbi:integrase core domain-containing protein [Streptomyces microflavus]|uniref:integrase core domain-containing protein n=1 Tax=Streptomyces microflavus TaxID=1919 RepID=UPI003D9E134C
MQGPWKDVDQVERAIFQWITWYNEEWLHSALDYVPPASTREPSGEARSRPRSPPEPRPADSTKLGAAQHEGGSRRAT